MVQISSQKVYSWTGSTWDCVGTVTDGPEAAAPACFYVGDEFFPEGNYDFIFQVDLEEGTPTVPLPYRLGENTYDVAEKFLSRQKLDSRNYLGQIAKFIETNSQQSQSMAAPPVSSTSSHPELLPCSEHFPAFQPLTFKGGDFDRLLKKLLETNEELPDDCEGKLSACQLTYLQEGIARMHKPDFILQSFRSCEIDVFFNRLQKRPADQLMPVIDIWRAMALHPQCADLHKGSNMGWNHIAFALHVITSLPCTMTAVLAPCRKSR
eukprot:TRINITY_DN54551_c0_g1_i1.p1 TRINITY_DN54551_c0_g1~~TRINITY_DN54551_c0_g1_i1.p1  ORF type:complete len:265 (+),score=16.34 TRINITY_DN54551_c0_g1_i1:28-822(+)